MSSSSLHIRCCVACLSNVHISLNMYRGRILECMEQKKNDDNKGHEKDL